MLLIGFLLGLVLVAALAALRLNVGLPVGPASCEPPEGLHLLYCGAELMAVTADAVPAPPGRSPRYTDVRVANARGALAAAERSHTILQSWVDVSHRTSVLRYIETGAELFLKLLYSHAGATASTQRALLLGLGAGALPTTMRRLCDERIELRGCASLRLTAVDSSVDALRITRAFVLRDDGVRLRYVHDTAESFVAAAAAVAASAPGAWRTLTRLLRGSAALGAPYDLIVNDAYQGAVGVARDAAFLADAKNALQPGSGVYCVNVLSTSADQDARARADEAMLSVFGEVFVEGEGSGNVWLCARAPA